MDAGSCGRAKSHRSSCSKNFPKRLCMHNCKRNTRSGHLARRRMYHLGSSQPEFQNSSARPSICASHEDARETRGLFPRRLPAHWLKTEDVAQRIMRMSATTWASVRAHKPSEDNNTDRQRTYPHDETMITARNKTRVKKQVHTHKTTSTHTI